MIGAQGTIRLFEDPAGAEAWCREARAAGRTLALVPTMGALHDGHLSLVRRAAGTCDLVCASVFVNPLQFDEAGDFDAYPRDFERDAGLLAGAGAQMAFTGTLAGFFPGSDGDMGRIARRDPGPAAAGLEGEFRTGHFDGVATICARLFELTGADVAVFGAKDYQQTLVVAHVARCLGHPRIDVGPTVREPSGLARSSRNERLGAEERERAAAIFRALSAARELWRAGERDAGALRGRLADELAREPGLAVEYAALRDPEAWTASEPAGPLGRAVALVAARLGDVRLIDNLRLDGEPS